jgi:hypothetical protein
MNGAGDEACKQANGHDVHVYVMHFCKEHTHTRARARARARTHQIYLAKNKHPQNLNCQKESEFHKMEFNSAL